MAGSDVDSRDLTPGPPARNGGRFCVNMGRIICELGDDAMELVTLGQDRFDEAVDVLCDAFGDYRVMRFIVGPSTSYDRRLRPLIGFFTAARILRRDLVLGVAGAGRALVAIANVTRPGERSSPAEIDRHPRTHLADVHLRTAALPPEVMSASSAGKRLRALTFGIRDVPSRSERRPVHAHACAKARLRDGSPRRSHVHQRMCTRAP
jgi:hypothetical protein